MITIHPTAIVDTGAQLGNGTRVWHWSHISAGATIGECCSFGQNVYVGNEVKIGNNVKVQNNVSIYDAVTIEDDVFCGPSMVFTNVYNPRCAVIRKEEYRPTLIKKRCHTRSKLHDSMRSNRRGVCFCCSRSCYQPQCKALRTYGRCARQTNRLDE